MATTRYSTDLITDMQTEITMLRATITSMRWNSTLKMLTPAGLSEAIRALPNTTTYTVVICDIDRLKNINEATGNHFQTNRYLAAGLKVRRGEIAGQLFGDEFGFFLDEHVILGGRRRREHNIADAFVARIARQLAGQPLTISERYALAAAQHVPVERARLSATFATQSGVAAADVPQAIESLSCQVLAMKKVRDAR